MTHPLLDMEIGPVEVQVANWGKIHVRRAMAYELDCIIEILDTTTGSERFIRLACLGACDQFGTRLFADDDADRLRKKPLETVGDIAMAFLEANGLGEEKPEKKSSGPSNGSSSTLPENSAKLIPYR